MFIVVPKPEHMGLVVKWRGLVTPCEEKHFLKHFLCVSIFKQKPT